MCAALASFMNALKTVLEHEEESERRLFMKHANVSAVRSPRPMSPLALHCARSGDSDSEDNHFRRSSCTHSEDNQYHADRTSILRRWASMGHLGNDN